MISRWFPMDFHKKSTKTCQKLYLTVQQIKHNRQKFIEVRWMSSISLSKRTTTYKTSDSRSGTENSSRSIFSTSQEETNNIRGGQFEEKGSSQVERTPQQIKKHPSFREFLAPGFKKSFDNAFTSLCCERFLISERTCGHGSTWFDPERNFPDISSGRKQPFWLSTVFNRKKKDLSRQGCLVRGDLVRCLSETLSGPCPQPCS